MSDLTALHNTKLITRKVAVKRNDLSRNTSTRTPSFRMANKALVTKVLDFSFYKLDVGVLHLNTSVPDFHSVS